MMAKTRPKDAKDTGLRLWEPSPLPETAKPRPPRKRKPLAVGLRHERVLKAVVRANKKGLTDDEMHFLLGPGLPRATRIELARLGLIEASDQTRLTHNGRRAIVWRSTAAGRDYVARLPNHRKRNVP